MLEPLFVGILDRIDRGLEHGAIDARLPDGSARRLGGRGDGPVAIVDLRKWRALLRLVQSGSAGWYRAYAKGEWASPDPVPLFDLFMRNRATLAEVGRAGGPSRLAKRVLHWFNRNTPMGASRNIEAHYDLGNDFYATWLDSTMNYSSAVFGNSDDLQAAQKRKCALLYERLGLTRPSDVLEIGSGWGYFSRGCARRGHRVTGITLSPSQKEWSEVKAAAMANRPRYELCDYRQVEGQYDAVASIEMVEAVGQEYWPEYLDAIVRCLRPGARAALQFIAIADDVFESYAENVDFIQRYVFPGGMLLSESRFRALAEERGLGWRDCRHFGPHYAETLRRWRLRFDDAVSRQAFARAGDGEFVRLWRYYLQYCEGGFRGGGISVAQVTLIKSS